MMTLIVVVRSMALVGADGYRVMRYGLILDSNDRKPSSWQQDSTTQGVASSIKNSCTFLAAAVNDSRQFQEITGRAPAAVTAGAVLNIRANLRCFGHQ